MASLSPYQTLSCSPVELAAQLTIDEAAIITEAWNKKIDEMEGKS